MDLKTLCKERGVEYIDRGNGHIQLKGPLLVNYYPDSKFKSAYVAGTKKAAKRVSPEDAIAMCFSAPDNLGHTDRRRGNSRRQRAAMLKKSDKCHWCGARLTLETSTVEHIIPLARGGLDNANNRELACKKCNNDRGSDMPELTQETRPCSEA